MRAILASVLAFTALSPVAIADPRADAQVIVDMTVTEEVITATFAALSELVVGSIQNETARAGRPLSNDAAQTLGNMMMAEMAPLLVSEMRAKMGEVYLSTLSPEAIAELRQFFETPAGTEWAEAQPDFLRESTRLGQELAEPVAGQAVVAMIEAVLSGEFPEGTPAEIWSELKAQFGQ